MRIQKYLSEVGFCSRRDAEDLIRAGKILVNGIVATLGDKATGKEMIVIDGKELEKKELPKRKVLLFFKPSGVECTLAVINGVKTLLDFDFGPDRVFPVGYLDRQSSGLLILTNDGNLGNKLAQPDRGDENEYLMVVENDITQATVLEISKKIMEAHKPPTPCKIEDEGGNRFQLLITNGKIKHIRKVCVESGLEISDLLHIRVGDLSLGELEVGAWRMLTEAELKLL